MVLHGVTGSRSIVKAGASLSPSLLAESNDGLFFDGPRTEKWPHFGEDLTALALRIVCSSFSPDMICGELGRKEGPDKKEDYSISNILFLIHSLQREDRTVN